MATLQGRYATMSVLHPKLHIMKHELETELLKFPKGRNDDLIDALSIAIYATQTNIIKRNSGSFRIDMSQYYA